jgi:REP element-mobilizing transposase RayT
MGNRPRKGYNYNRAGIAMITLKAKSGVWLCRIAPDSFELTAVGRLVQQALNGISTFYEQVKIGHYQIMPDHLHVLIHVVRDLPAGVTLRRVIRGFKIGLDRSCREAFGEVSYQVFEKGMHESLIFDQAHLDREVAYVRDNVRRYRMRKANAALFREPQAVMTLSDGVTLWGIGNRFLLDHPRRVRVQFSRSATEEEWRVFQDDLTWYLSQEYVFVSPFISPYERRVLQAIIERGGRAIRLTHTFFDERYKPMGQLFDLCCGGRLLEVSVAGEFKRYAGLDRATCLRLNEVAGVIATTQWSQWSE